MAIFATFGQGGSATVILKNRIFGGFLEQLNVNVIGRYINYLHFRVFDSLFILTFLTSFLSDIQQLPLWQNCGGRQFLTREIAGSIPGRRILTKKVNIS